MYSRFSVNPKTTKRIVISIVLLCAFFFVQKWRTPLYLIPEREENLRSDIEISSSGTDSAEEKDEIFDSEQTAPSEKQTVIIYLTGEVKKPGIVELDSDMRLKDALEMVGGFTEDADINSINLAEKVEDERHYIITKIGESPVSNPVSVSSSQKSDKVNINRASVEELKTLDGIGDALAQRIISYRDENGNFSTVEEIKNVSGIGEKKFEGIKEHISIK